jgi:hypothetical protein
MSILWNVRFMRNIPQQREPTNKYITEEIICVVLYGSGQETTMVWFTALGTFAFVL